MSGIILNLDFTGGAVQRKTPKSSHNHKRFIQRRAYLHKKQLQQATPAWPEAQCAVGKLGGQRWKETLLPSPNWQSPALTKPSAPGQKPALPSDTTLLLSECQSGVLPSWKTNVGRGVGSSCKGSSSSSSTASCPAARSLVKPYKCVALDCEMVGTGQGGKKSELARCSMIGYNGDLVYDKYILPPNPITDYRTRWSGIRKYHMRNATPFKLAQKEILKVLYGKIVVGHAVHNDFKALKYFHPESLTRDTSKIPLLNRKGGFPERQSVSLKKLTKQLLHRDIQVGKTGHSSVEDARATMELYKLVEAELELEGTAQTERK